MSLTVLGRRPVRLFVITLPATLKLRSDGALEACTHSRCFASCANPGYCGWLSFHHGSIPGKTELTIQRWYRVISSVVGSSCTSSSKSSIRRILAGGSTISNASIAGSVGSAVSCCQTFVLTDSLSSSDKTRIDVCRE